MEAPLGTYVQYVYMTPELTMLTFKRWDDILKQADVENRFHYASLLQQFAKGMAYANTDNLKMAKSSLTILEALLPEKDLSVVFTPFNAPASAATIAKYLLMGTIAEKERNYKKAINYFKMAVITEDSLVYNEPRDWLVPARHFLGNALLAQKKYKEAANVFSEDLKLHPNNYIATKGLKNTMHQK
jgi:tetratricopeptide (TPR) repeat protein